MVFIILGIIVLILVVFMYYYNRFVVLENRINNSLSQIDVQLKRRADLIPNLIETVKGYTKHETKAIKLVTEARKAMLSANGIQAKMKANQGLESALKSIFAIAENYQDLKANTNFLKLQEELASTEDRVAYSRQYYNDTVLSYENTIRKMPGAFFAKLYGKEGKKYLEINEAERKVVKVKFEDL